MSDNTAPGSQAPVLTCSSFDHPSQRRGGREGGRRAGGRGWGKAVRDKPRPGECYERSDAFHMHL